MSKVKYPDKEKIRIQIDEILDKSELFDASEDKASTYTNDKIVHLKPVKQHLPVRKYVTVVAAVAAILVFVTAVKNYKAVNSGQQYKSSSLVPLATSSTQADEQSVEDNADIASEAYGIYGYNSYERLYSSLDYKDVSTIYNNKRIEYGYTYIIRYDKVTMNNGAAIYVEVPYDISYNINQMYLDWVNDSAAAMIEETIKSYVDKKNVSGDGRITCNIINDTLQIYVDNTIYDTLSLIQ